MFGPFIVKRVGSAIGSKAFNNQVTSCDGMNSDGKACCFEPKEAAKKNMPNCTPQKPVQKPVVKKQQTKSKK
jgi:hypothetical protein